MTAESPKPKPPMPPFEPGNASRIRNFLIAMVAIALSTSIFFGLQSPNGPSKLAALAESAVPLEEALANDKPTMMEFYANWCTSCQAMAQDLIELETEYGDRVNFVMLNVDNDRWLPEMLAYRVDGIPHFVYLNRQGEAIASIIGEQPRTVMAANLEALSNDAALPYAPASGQVSKVNTAAAKATPDDPRSHGSQVNRG
ncbi:MAG: thioredoxin family protein [Cyanobacteriota bacterium]